MGPLPFKVAPDLGGEYGLATSDQRHRAVFNGIFQLPKGFLVSGFRTLRIGRGQARPPVATAEPSVPRLASRPAWTETLVPRNNFVGDPIHRVDLRISKVFPIGPRFRIEGLIDAFNLFNRENYNAYTLTETSALLGQGSDGSLARRLQMGFRVTF
jgi:hypothetical protein